MTPTNRTVLWLRRFGYWADVVERWRGPRTSDLFGMFDVVALGPPGRTRPVGVIGVQCTTRPHVRERIQKVSRAPALRAWLGSRNGAWVVGWAGGKGENQGEPHVWRVVKTAEGWGWSRLAPGFPEE